MKILAIDIGNTTVVGGLFFEDELKFTFRISTDLTKTSDEYGFLISELIKRKLGVGEGEGREKIDDIVISCVVPPLLPTFQELSRKYFSINPLILEPGVKTGIHILYENPKEVGADRIANAVGAYEKYKNRGKALVAVDFGTATTFDYVTKKGEYGGGAIVPGILISLEALFLHASKLPRIEPSTPTRVIGKNTTQSIQSGIIYGYASLVDGMIEKIKEEVKEDLFVIATGGLAHLIANHCKKVDVVDENLTLEGLRIIHERNRVKRGKGREKRKRRER